MSKSRNITRFVDNLMESCDRSEKIKSLSNSQLANELMDKVWANMECFTEQSDLVQEAMERLERS